MNVPEDQFPMYTITTEGVTLRQYYAATALSAWLQSKFCQVATPKHLAHYAFEIADAMIAFEKEEEKQ